MGHCNIGLNFELIFMYLGHRNGEKNSTLKYVIYDLSDVLQALLVRVDTTKNALTILLDEDLIPQTSQYSSSEQEKNLCIVLHPF